MCLRCTFGCAQADEGVYAWSPGLCVCARLGAFEGWSALYGRQCPKRIVVTADNSFRRAHSKQRVEESSQLWGWLNIVTQQTPCGPGTHTEQSPSCLNQPLPHIPSVFTLCHFCTLFNSEVALWVDLVAWNASEMCESWLALILMLDMNILGSRSMEKLITAQCHRVWCLF